MESGYIYIANNIFSSLLAISFDEQAQGLMYIDPPVPIMSFIYAQPQINRFWMKATKAPLDIIFCNQGEVKQICYGKPYSTAMIGDYQFSDLVIELPFGTAYNSGIKLGHKAGIVKPTADELKKIIAEKTYSIVKL